MANPTTLGAADFYGIEVLRPSRAGRSKKQIAQEGKSNYRWIMGGKLAIAVNQLGLDVRHSQRPRYIFRLLIAQFQEEMMILAGSGFHAEERDPKNLKIC